MEGISIEAKLELVTRIHKLQVLNNEAIISRRFADDGLGDRTVREVQEEVEEELNALYDAILTSEQVEKVRYNPAIEALAGV